MSVGLALYIMFTCYHFEILVGLYSVFRVLHAVGDCPFKVWQVARFYIVVCPIICFEGMSCRHTWALFVVECRNTYESAHLSLANLYGTLPMGTL